MKTLLLHPTALLFIGWAQVTEGALDTITATFGVQKCARLASALMMTCRALGWQLRGAQLRLEELLFEVGLRRLR